MVQTRRCWVLGLMWTMAACGSGDGAATGMTDAGEDAVDAAANDAANARDAGTGSDGGLVDGSEASVGVMDASCATLPSGALTRNPQNPLLRNGPEPYDDGKTGPRVVLKVGPADYRIWYEAVSSSGITAVGYATSTDGISWTKRGIVMSPSLPWERSEVSPNSILVENGVYRLWYHGGGYPMGNQRLGNARVGYATSSDGITWTKRGNPVLDIGASGSFDDDQAAEPRVMRVGARYRMYYTGHNAASARNALGMASSNDGLSWTKAPANPILDESRWGNNWGGAFFQEGTVWHLWRGFTTGTTYGLRYMSSSDGISWIDGPQNPVLTPSADPNAADYQFVGDSVSGYRDGADYRILYTGFNASFGTLGRFEGVCQASVASPCP